MPVMDFFVPMPRYNSAPGNAADDWDLGLSVIFSCHFRSNMCRHTCKDFRDFMLVLQGSDHVDATW